MEASSSSSSKVEGNIFFWINLPSERAVSEEHTEGEGNTWYSREREKQLLLNVQGISIAQLEV